MYFHHLIFLQFLFYLQSIFPVNATARECQRSNLLLLAIIVGSCLDMALPFQCESVVCSTLLLPYLQLSTSTEVAAATGVAAAAGSNSCCYLAAPSCNLNTPYNCFSLNVMAAAVAFLRLIGNRDVASNQRERAKRACKRKTEKREREREKKEEREREGEEDTQSVLFCLKLNAFFGTWR